MPNFTAETARIAALLSHAPNSARHYKPLPVLERIIDKLQALPAAQPALIQLEPSKDTTLKQIERLDQDFDEAESPRERLAIVSAKEKLWKLIYPGQGNLKPSQRKPAPFQPEPVQCDPVQSAASVEPVLPLP